MAHDLQTVVREQMRRAIIGLMITCRRTGEVLDVRTAVFLVDADGDPVVAASQEGWRQMVADGTAETLERVHQLTADPTTVVQLPASPTSARFTKEA
jgi:hypothetical protein